MSPGRLERKLGHVGTAQYRLRQTAESYARRRALHRRPGRDESLPDPGGKRTVLLPHPLGAPCPVSLAQFRGLKVEVARASRNRRPCSLEGQQIQQVKAAAGKLPLSPVASHEPVTAALIDFLVHSQDLELAATLDFGACPG